MGVIVSPQKIAKINNGKDKRRPKPKAKKPRQASQSIKSVAGYTVLHSPTSDIVLCIVGCVINFLSANWFGSSIVHSVLNLKVPLSIMCVA